MDSENHLRPITANEITFLNQLQEGTEVETTAFVDTLMIGVEGIEGLLELNFGGNSYKYALFVKSVIYSLFNDGAIAIHPLSVVDPNYTQLVKDFVIERSDLEKIVSLYLKPYKTITVVYVNGKEQPFSLRQFFTTLLGYANYTLIES